MPLSEPRRAEPSVMTKSPLEQFVKLIRIAAALVGLER